MKKEVTISSNGILSFAEDNHDVLCPLRKDEYSEDSNCCVRFCAFYREENEGTSIAAFCALSRGKIGVIVNSVQVEAMEEQK